VIVVTVKKKCKEQNDNEIRSQLIITKSLKDGWQLTLGMTVKLGGWVTRSEFQPMTRKEKIDSKIKEYKSRKKIIYRYLIKIALSKLDKRTINLYDHIKILSSSRNNSPKFGSINSINFTEVYTHVRAKNDKEFDSFLGDSMDETMMKNLIEQLDQ